jgi:hypothetical protein
MGQKSREPYRDVAFCLYLDHLQKSRSFRIGSKHFPIENDIVPAGHACCIAFPFGALFVVVVVVVVEEAEDWVEGGTDDGVDEGPDDGADDGDCCAVAC